MKSVLPYRGDDVLKYSITYKETTPESLEDGDFSDQGYISEPTELQLSDILKEAYEQYAIYSPTAIGSWESTSAKEDKDYWEKGINKYFGLHITNLDDSQISKEEHDFITALLNDGKYSFDEEEDDYEWSGKENFGVGGWIFGSLVGAFLGYQLGKAVGYGRAHEEFKQGGSIMESVLKGKVSKDDYFLIVRNWVYFTFNFPYKFVENAFENEGHLKNHFVSKWEGYDDKQPSASALVDFYSNLSGDNREILVKYIQSNYGYSESDKLKIQKMPTVLVTHVISHWNAFCLNFPYGWLPKVFTHMTNHFEGKWSNAYERAGSRGAINRFFTELDADNERILTDWVYDNYTGYKFEQGGEAGTLFDEGLFTESSTYADGGVIDEQINHLKNGGRYVYRDINNQWHEIIKSGNIYLDKITNERLDEVSVRSALKMYNNESYRGNSVSDKSHKIINEHLDSLLNKSHGEKGGEITTGFIHKKYGVDRDELMEHYNFYVEDEEENDNEPLSFDSWVENYGEDTAIMLSEISSEKKYKDGGDVDKAERRERRLNYQQKAFNNRLNNPRAKTVELYFVQGNYGQGWEDLTAHETRLEAFEEKKVYDENESYAHRVITRKVNKDDYSKGNYRDGGAVKNKVYILTGYSASAYEDSYEEGELDYVSSWDENYSKEFKSKESLIKYINENIIHVDYKESDFDWETGEGKNIQTNVLCSFDDHSGYLPADEKEKTLWKKGKKKLYNVHYWIDVQAVVSTTYEDGGEIKTLWKIPIEKGTGKRAGEPILLKKGSSLSIKRWLNKNKSSVEDGWSGIQEWHENATVEEVSKYNMSEGGSTYEGGGAVKHTSNGAKISSLFAKSNELRKELLDQGYSKGQLIKLAYGENYRNVDSALPHGSLERLGIEPMQRYRYVMDYTNNKFGEIVDLYEKISERNPIVTVFNSDYEDKGNYPILEAYDKFFKGEDFNYLIDAIGSDKYAKGGDVDNDIIHVYKNIEKEKKEILSTLKVPYGEAYGNVQININDVFVESGSDDLKYNYVGYGGVQFMGNINGKTANRLYYKNEDLKNNIENVIKRLDENQETSKEIINQIIEQKGKPKEQLAILYHRAKKYENGGGVEKPNYSSDDLYYIFEGVEHLHQKPIYRVESTSINENEYVGEWHENKESAEKNNFNVMDDFKNNDNIDLDGEFKRGGLYEVQKKGENNPNLSETLMSAKNLADLRKKVEEKYGTTKGFIVSKRDSSGRFVSVNFSKGGSIDNDWCEEALTELIEETGNDSLIISEDSENGKLCTITDGDSEYFVFEDEDSAHDYAVERVKQYLEETPEYFNQDWLLGQIDSESTATFFTNVYDEWNTSYATDIMLEDSDKYANRLIEELVDNGLMDDETANSENSEAEAEQLIQDFVNLLTESQINEGDNGFKHYLDNFGKEEAMKLLIKQNLIDIDEASENAVDEDGIAHFIASYDHEQIDLPSGYVAYRTN